MRYLFGGLELLIAFALLMLAIQAFSESGGASVGSGGSHGNFFGKVLLVPFAAFALSGVFLMLTGKLWTQLFMLPVIIVVVWLIIVSD